MPGSTYPQNDYSRLSFFSGPFSIGLLLILELILKLLRYAEMYQVLKSEEVVVSDKQQTTVDSLVIAGFFAMELLALWVMKRAFYATSSSEAIQCMQLTAENDRRLAAIKGKFKSILSNQIGEEFDSERLIVSKDHSRDGQGFKARVRYTYASRWFFYDEPFVHLALSEKSIQAFSRRDNESINEAKFILNHEAAHVVLDHLNVKKQVEAWVDGLSFNLAFSTVLPGVLMLIFFGGKGLSSEQQSAFIRYGLLSLGSAAQLFLPSIAGLSTWQRIANEHQADFAALRMIARDIPAAARHKPPYPISRLISLQRGERRTTCCFTFKREVHLVGDEMERAWRAVVTTDDEDTAEGLSDSICGSRQLAKRRGMLTEVLIPPATRSMDLVGHHSPRLSLSR